MGAVNYELKQTNAGLVVLSLAQNSAVKKSELRFSLEVTAKYAPVKLHGMTLENFEQPNCLHWNVF